MKDQEFDKLMLQIANDAALKDHVADEIADSPGLWWSIQSEIRKAEPEEAPWPPNVLRRSLMIGFPVTAMLLIGIGFYLNGLRSDSEDRAGAVSPQALISNGNAAGSSNPRPDDVTIPAPVAASTKTSSMRARTVNAVAKTRNTHTPKTLVAKSTGTPTPEIKSDFIALAYARSPESGQLVRVKVPSSMMVSLGVVPTVNDPSKLVDAEVLVGDDGLTHSIRFIRQ